MGASRSRLIRQVLTESNIGQSLGGLHGLGLAYASAKILMATIPAGFHPLNPDFVNPTALGFTAAIAVVTGVLSGLAPAFQISRVNLHDTLKEGGRAGLGTSHGGLRNAFVVTEVTLATVLLMAAGLLVKSFLHSQQVNPGFRIDNLLTAN